MKWLITVALSAMIVAIFGYPAFLAQESQQLHDCLNNTALGQQDWNRCAAEEVKRVDAELNEVYQQLLSAASSPQNAEITSLAIPKIKAAEQAWIAYRDAYLDAMYPASDKRAEYGSKFPLDYGLYRAEITRQHINDLKKLLSDRYNQPQR